MTAKGARAVAGDAGAKSPGMRLNRRMKDIIGTGLLPSMSPSALTVLTYAAAYGDFSTCKVFLGAKTIAANTRWHRGSVRRGIAELLDVGFLVELKAATYRRAAVYRLAIVPERVAAARERIEAVGAKRRKTPEKLAAEAEAKRRQGGEGAHGCAPRGLMDEPRGGSWVSPEGAHGCAPNHSLTVLSSLRERSPSGRSSRRSGGQGAGEHERRLKAAAVKRKRA